MWPERNICDLTMIAADMESTKKEDRTSENSVSISINNGNFDKIASFRILECEAELFAHELEVLSASIRSWMYFRKYGHKVFEDDPSERRAVASRS
jgi:hypothetical protein